MNRTIFKLLHKFLLSVVNNRTNKTNELSNIFMFQDVCSSIIEKKIVQLLVIIRWLMASILSHMNGRLYNLIALASCLLYEMGSFLKPLYSDLYIKAHCL